MALESSLENEFNFNYVAIAILIYFYMINHHSIVTEQFINVSINVVILKVKFSYIEHLS